MSSFDMARVSVRLGIAQTKDEWPPLIFILGDIVPETIRMLVFCLIGYTVNGDTGLQYAWLGSIVLVVANTCVAHTSDIPALDAMSGTIPVLSRAPLPLIVQYFLRSLPLMLFALVKALIVTVVVGLIVGQSAAVPQALMSLWAVAPALLSATALSFALMAPALGSGWEHLSYNVATAVITVASGAIISIEALPVVRFLGDVLPLRHSLLAFRELMDNTGTPDIAFVSLQMGLELTVAVWWSLVAYAVFAVRLRRDRNQGTGGFS